MSELILSGPEILNSTPFEQARTLPEACRSCEFRDPCHGGCAGRRRLQGALWQPDFYCPIIRGEHPRLDIRMAANRDLPKLGSSCTTVVIAHASESRRSTWIDGTSPRVSYCAPTQVSDPTSSM